MSWPSEEWVAARLNHMWASTGSCVTPWLSRYLTPRFELRAGALLARREAIPSNRFAAVRRDTPALLVPEPELQLRFGVALVGREPIPPHRQCFGIFHRLDAKVGICVC